MIPSASGGIGHISRTATLARALRRLDPAVAVELLLDTERLRPFNIDAARRMGFTPRLLPPCTCDTRDAIARACLDGADIVVDDCALLAAAAPGRAAGGPGHPGDVSAA